MPFVNSFGLLVAVLVLVSYLIYRKSIPTPIPGIPYSSSAIRPLGDAPAALEFQAKHDQSMAFMLEKCHELGSPIFQVFMEPFKKPWVVVADSVTIEDILSRRTKEFDISSWFAGLFKGTIPGGHLHLPTNDQWRKQRRLVGDTMSTQFLRDVVAKVAHSRCFEMIGVWDEKIRLGGDRVFAAESDVEYLLLDSVWGAAFGSSVGAIQAQKDLLASLDSLPQLASPASNDLVVFPHAPPPPTYSTITALADSHQIPIKSPIGPLHHKLALRFYPKLRKAMLEKEALVTERLDFFFKKAQSTKTGDVACAADLLMQRELAFAEKEGRKPNYNTEIIRDELYMFLQAGHDTTSTTTQWSLKCLTAHQNKQTALRNSLQQELGSNPTAADIAKADLPYLDATIEEILRFAPPVGFLARETQVDCQILGYHVPANTNVVLLSLGPSYKTPAIALPANSKQHVRPENRFDGNWDSETLSVFQPERWLEQTPEGRVRFNSRAGPSHVFGTGPRHCFGKRMAMMNLRVFIVLVLLNFELQSLPADLENFDAVDRMMHKPKSFYLKLKRL